MIIYKVTNLINGKIYIGKTIRNLRERKYRHLSNAKAFLKDMVLYSAIRKYGQENFKWEIIEKCLFDEALLVLEKYYIKKFNTKVPHGYNMTNGGEGTTGYKPSEKSRKKISAAKIGKHLTAEHKLKMSINAQDNPNYGMRGKHPSDETRMKMSKAHSGRKGIFPSDETRAKMSASQNLRYKNLKQIKYGN